MVAQVCGWKMKIKKLLNDIIDQLSRLSPVQKKNVMTVSLALFLVNFSYPIIRSTVDSIFIDVIGALKSPQVWLYSVLVLVVLVYFLSELQKRISIQYIFFATVVITPIVLIGSTVLIKAEMSSFAYVLSAWKEIYIVLLIHILLGYINASIDVESAKILYGPIGAINGLGGVFGGLLTAELTHSMSVELILQIGAIFVLISGFVFLLTTRKIVVTDNGLHPDKAEISPLASIKDVKHYVFWIVFIIIMSQFCINLVTFKFNILFEQLVPDKLVRTRYFGNINAAMSGLSLLIQIFLVPFCLKIFKNKQIQMFIPLLYMLITFLGLFIGGSFLLPISLTYIIFKGMDYSLFSSAKEILYFPLNKTQRYGAKYIADIVLYRAAKGPISFVLIFFQTSRIIDIMLFSFLILWLLSLIPLFTIYRELTQEKNT